MTSRRNKTVCLGRCLFRYPGSPAANRTVPALRELTVGDQRSCYPGVREGNFSVSEGGTSFAGLVSVLARDPILCDECRLAERP